MLCRRAIDETVIAIQLWQLARDVDFGVIWQGEGQGCIVQVFLSLVEHDKLQVAAILGEEKVLIMIAITTLELPHFRSDIVCRTLFVRPVCAKQARVRKPGDYCIGRRGMNLGFCLNQFVEFGAGNRRGQLRQAAGR